MTFDEVHVLIKRGDVERLRNSLEAGLDPNLSNRYSWTLLMIAAMSGNTPIGRLLLERGAALDARNKFGDSALSLATHTGHPSFVKMLLDHGASMDCGPNNSPLDSHFEWYEKHSDARGCINHLRNLFADERAKRAEQATE